LLDPEAAAAKKADANGLAAGQDESGASSHAAGDAGSEVFAGAAPRVTGYGAGCRVELFGLRKKADLNGAEGAVLAFVPDSERYSVRRGRPRFKLNPAGLSHSSAPSFAFSHGAPPP
jgi:hypothetical protein